MTNHGSGSRAVRIATSAVLGDVGINILETIYPVIVEIYVVGFAVPDVGVYSSHTKDSDPVSDNTGAIVVTL